MTRPERPEHQRADPLRPEAERPDKIDTEPATDKPSELTSVAPDFSGKVTNRPTPSGAEVEGFDQAVEEERQEDS